MIDTGEPFTPPSWDMGIGGITAAIQPDSSMNVTVPGLGVYHFPSYVGPDDLRNALSEQFVGDATTGHLPSPNSLGTFISSFGGEFVAPDPNISK